MTTTVRNLIIGVVAVAAIVGILLATGVIGGESDAEKKAVKDVPGYDLSY